MPKSEREREADRLQHERKRREANIPPRAKGPQIVHGTTTGYRNGCRCDQCREEVNRYYRKRNGGTYPSSPGKFNVKPSTSGGNRRD